PAAFLSLYRIPLQSSIRILQNIQDCCLSDRLKIAFSPYCVCRGDHWSPASLPPQRIFRDSFLARQTGTGEQCSPLQKFFRQSARLLPFSRQSPIIMGNDR
ncbi:MAG: hypothetical protein U0I97_04620, partial [Gemmiger formicilis]|nr:hypothetical protein [Gemmiger formicilis]